MRSPAFHGFVLVLILLAAAGVFLLGLDWGLPSRGIDAYLFGGSEPWSGQKLAALKSADEWRSARLGADVDRDPLATSENWVDLTADDQSRADILIRYRLYSHQPDEMITFRAIAQMKPAEWKFDPRLYQYGGLFIYPVAALLKACDALGWITARSDLAYYYDHPEAFGKFYLVARGYVVFFALMGVLACYQLGRGLGGRVAGLIAALLFVCMPVTITMAHEAKPHLPAAVLMIYAGLAGFAYIKRPTSRRYFLAALMCGLSCAMVLSAWPVLVLLGLVLLLDRRPFSEQWWRFVWGVMATVIVFLVCNPYLLINLFADREVLRSNFSNSRAMYQFGRFGDGAQNVASLLVAAMGPLLAVCGLFLAFTTTRTATWRRGLLLWLPALLMVLMFVGLGAGKPGEYGRFLVLPAVALMLPVAVYLRGQFRRQQAGTGVALVLAVAMTVLFGLDYELGFYADAGDSGSRRAAARYLADELARSPQAVVGVRRQPAPYAVPPLDFASRRVVYLDRGIDLASVAPVPDLVVADFDDLPPVGHRLGEYELVRQFPSGNRPGAFETVISWANKPLGVYKKRPKS